MAVVGVDDSLMSCRGHTGCGPPSYAENQRSSAVCGEPKKHPHPPPHNLCNSYSYSRCVAKRKVLGTCGRTVLGCADWQDTCRMSHQNAVWQNGAWVRRRGERPKRRPPVLLKLRCKRKLRAMYDKGVLGSDSEGDTMPALGMQTINDGRPPFCPHRCYPCAPNLVAISRISLTAPYLAYINLLWPHLSSR